MTDDLISRQEAQRLFGKALTYKEQIGKLTWTTSEVKQWLADCTEQLPPALRDTDTDTISRQAAIDALHTWFQDGFEEDKWWNSTHVLEAIEGVPPAQHEPCEDAVSREAVSEWLKQYGQDVLHGKYKFSLMYIWKNLMDLPAVQIKRKNGKWIDNSPVTMKCNQCGFVIKDWDWHRFKCCPNCGANMKGEQDD